MRCNGQRFIGSVFKPGQTWVVYKQEKQDEEQDLPVSQKSSTASSKAGQDSRSLLDDPKTERDFINSDVPPPPLVDAYFNNDMISKSALTKDMTLSVVVLLTLLVRTSKLVKEKLQEVRLCEGERGNDKR
ncbi:hypothetical protein ABVK25_004712 [Lepraria finkii]|uniref:Uncharacterized protein n=1 Tax=Lepraria finkii TaxID=1340010 RepID=A0ABR4BAQ0_9LECA